jgi:hypothetical protein
MGISIRLRCFDGTGQLAEYLSPVDISDASGVRNQINRIVDLAHRDSAEYPLLSGVDPVDDTSFNILQAARLQDELLAIKVYLDEAAALAADAVIDLIVEHMTPGPGRACYHRHLQFLGD